MSDPNLTELIPNLPQDIAQICVLRASSKYRTKLQAVCRGWDLLLRSPDFQEERRRAGYTDHYVCLIQALPRAPESKGKHPVFGLSVYDRKQASWDRLPPISSHFVGLPLFSQCVSVGENLVLLGGWDPVTWEATKCVYLFNFFTGTWRKGADMLGVRSFFACGVIGDTIIVAGGHDDTKNSLDTAEVYDLKSDRWQALPRMSQGRDECKGAVVDGKFYTVSGYTTETQGRFAKSADVFDFSTGCWSVAENMWPLATCPSAIISFHGQLFAMLRHDVLRYNVGENLWVACDAIPEAVRIAPSATVMGDSIFVTGSARSGGGGVCNTYVYKPKLEANASSKWMRVDNGDEFSGLVQVACTVEI